MTEPLARFGDWRERLDAYLDSLDGKPFDWVKINCAFFSADCVEVQTGVDLAAAFRGKFMDQAGAMHALKAAGYDNLTDAVIGTQRLPEISLGEARIGDVAVVDVPKIGPCLAVVGGVHLNCMTL